MFLPFEKALAYARSLALKTKAAWYAWSSSGARPANIPARPDVTYKHSGWQGFAHWLNTCTRSKTFLPFAKALLFVRTLGLKDRNAWQQWSRSGARPANIPGRPDVIYHTEGWQGSRHWLGITKTSAAKQKPPFVYLPFREARYL